VILEQHGLLLCVDSDHMNARGRDLQLWNIKFGCRIRDFINWKAFLT